MNESKYLRFFLLITMLLLSACGPEAFLPEQTSLTYPSVETEVVIATTGVRSCPYVPGVSKPAEISEESFLPDAADPTFEPFPFQNSAVDANSTENQLQLYRQIWEQIEAHYAKPGFNGNDWGAIRKEYEAQIQKGLAVEDFFQAMKAMLFDLDSGYSGYWTPEEASGSGQPAEDRIGIGINAFFWQSDGEIIGTITGIQPGSPAELAGLKIHDTLLKVNGGPVLDKTGDSRTLGAEGRPVTVTVRSPGGTAREVTMVRAQPEGLIPQVDYCLVPTTHIGYIRLVNLTDSAAEYQMSDALKKLADEAPLDGLVVDTRMASGDPEIAEELLAFFTSGELGSYVSADGSTHPFKILPAKDVSNSQHVPLIVLQDETSGTLAATFGGILQLTGRARTVGSSVEGPFFMWGSYPLADGSSISMPCGVFRPAGRPGDQYDENEIEPSVSVPARWDQFTEADDPVLAKAVELLRDYWDGSGLA